MCVWGGGGGEGRGGNGSGVCKRKTIKKKYGDEGKSETHDLFLGCNAADKNVVSGKLDIDGFPPIGTMLEDGSPYYR